MFFKNEYNFQILQKKDQNKYKIKLKNKKEPK